MEVKGVGVSGTQGTQKTESESKGLKGLFEKVQEKIKKVINKENQDVKAEFSEGDDISSKDLADMQNKQEMEKKLSEFMQNLSQYGQISQTLKITKKDDGLNKEETQEYKQEKTRLEARLKTLSKELEKAGVQTGVDMRNIIKLHK